MSRPKPRPKPLDKNWRDKSIEQLENNFWGPANPEDTGLVQSCHHYRTIPLKRLDVNQLRLLIGQNIANTYTIPLALEFLQEDVLLEATFFPGDLLETVLKVNPEVWRNAGVLQSFSEIMNANEQRLREEADRTWALYQILLLNL